MDPETTTKTVCDKCGWFFEYQTECPNCHALFCTSDHEQAVRIALFRAKMNEDRITALENYVNTDVKNKINEIVTWCNDHKKPHDPDILPL